MDLEKKKKLWKAIAIITFPVWAVVAFAVLYVVVVAFLIVGGFLLIIGKNPFKLEPLDLSDIELDEF